MSHCQANYRVGRGVHYCVFADGHEGPHQDYLDAEFIDSGERVEVVDFAVIESESSELVRTYRETKQ